MPASSLAHLVDGIFLNAFFLRHKLFSHVKSGEKITENMHTKQREFSIQIDSELE